MRLIAPTVCRDCVRSATKGGMWNFVCGLTLLQGGSNGIEVVFGELLLGQCDLLAVALLKEPAGKKGRNEARKIKAAGGTGPAARRMFSIDDHEP